MIEESKGRSPYAVKVENSDNYDEFDREKVMLDQSVRTNLHTIHSQEEVSDEEESGIVGFVNPKRPKKQRKERKQDPLNTNDLRNTL